MAAKDLNFKNRQKTFGVSYLHCPNDTGYEITTHNICGGYDMDIGQAVMHETMDGIENALKLCAGAFIPGGEFEPADLCYAVGVIFFNKKETNKKPVVTLHEEWHYRPTIKDNIIGFFYRLQNIVTYWTKTNRKRRAFFKFLKEANNGKKFSDEEWEKYGFRKTWEEKR